MAPSRRVRWFHIVCNKKGINFARVNVRVSVCAAHHWHSISMIRKYIEASAAFRSHSSARGKGPARADLLLASRS
jgi:hypothetical protein